MIISLVAAVSKNNVIGVKGKLPWKIPGDMKRFRDLTMGRTMIMGRKAYDEIGKPLPGRKTILVSRSQKVTAENCVTVSSLEEAYELAKNEEEVMVAGGGEIFRQTLPRADRIYLTVIDKEFEGDVFFPEFSEEDFEKVYEERIEDTIPYTFYTYERRR